MRIGVLSDTHGNKKAIEEIMPALKKMDKVIHLGDHFYDMDFVKGELGDKLVTVYGNCDGGGDEKILDLGGGYGVRYIDSQPNMDIESNIENLLANVILKGELQVGATIKVNYANGRFVVE